MPPLRNEEIAHAPQPHLSNHLVLQCRCLMGVEKRVWSGGSVQPSGISRPLEKCACADSTHTPFAVWPTLTDIDGHFNRCAQRARLRTLAVGQQPQLYVEVPAGLTLVALSQTVVVLQARLDYLAGMVNGSCACGHVRYEVLGELLGPITRCPFENAQCCLLSV